ncbi:MAG: class I tRNA ligase family protein, partial [Actinomycetota bacterium]|nr:class I tRNA ligase family protein [Actinomycetota bacterium]
FVSTEDGTGIVHLAPYGEDDMNVAKRDDLPIVQMIDASGRVDPRAEGLAGLWVKDADPEIIGDLRSRDLLFRAEDYEHTYPHCWRCGTPLLYYPRRDWYIRTSQIRSELMSSNDDTNWQPPSIKYGRFGDWLANNVDWSLSRDRYWGTPLPIWRCEDEHATCIGSFAELAELSGAEVGDDFDPHRPFVDEITFECPTCGSAATRVKSVIDTWFDSGSMPFAQWHYPFENEEVFERRFPADFISEAIDQTRGWFYTLLAVATLVRGQNSFRNCVCLGHIVDADKRKMSKSLGNVIEPFSMLDEVGADALRWYMFTSGTPWSPRPVSLELIQESLRRYLLTLWNTYSFWVTYAALEGFDPANEHIPIHERPEMDRWILAELDDAVREVTRAFDDFDATAGGRRLDRLVDDLSNWYVRRSRRRFWRSAEDADTRSAFLTLWECLVTIAQLSAPYTPFVADEIYVNLTAPDDPNASVHLSRWPEPNGARVNDELREATALVRRLVVLGRAARTEASLKVRQPLAKAFVVVPARDYALIEGLVAMLKEELNVKDVEQSESAGDLADYVVKPNFKALGPRFGRAIKDVQKALGSLDPSKVVAQLDADGVVSLDVGDETVDLTRDDLDVRIHSRSGLQFVSDGPYGVALDVEMTPELEAEGLARDIVRTVQELRKSSGLAVEDRIELWLTTDEETASAVRAHEDYISGEVLATAVNFGAMPDGTPTAQAGDGVRVGLRKQPA